MARDETETGKGQTKKGVVSRDGGLNFVLYAMGSHGKVLSSKTIVTS